MTLAGDILDKCSPNLRQRVEGVDLERLSRIPLTRIVEKALPHIGLLEMVSAEAFAALYDHLYVAMFPHQPERERSDLITDRLQKEFTNQRHGLAPYRIVGIRDHQGLAIAAAQLSVLLLPDGRYAVPYLQYIYVRQENRRQDMADLLHTLILAVSSTDATNYGDRIVPFTLFETEPVGHGDTDESQANATQRVMIHTKAGSVALMLRREADGLLISPHVQPGLDVEDPPLSLVWVIRKSPAMALGDNEVDMTLIGPSLIAAYYRSLRDEGFPEANIQLAEDIVAKRSEGCSFVLVPLADVVLAPSVDIAERHPRAKRK